MPTSAWETAKAKSQYHFDTGFSDPRCTLQITGVKTDATEKFLLELQTKKLDTEIIMMKFLLWIWSWLNQYEHEHDFVQSRINDMQTDNSKDPI